MYSDEESVKKDVGLSKVKVEYYAGKTSALLNDTKPDLLNLLVK